MRDKRYFSMLIPVCLGLFLMFSLLGISPAQADIQLGKTYDQSNYQEIQDLLLPSVLNWVKQGAWVLRTEELEFEFKVTDPGFLGATQKNAGRFEMNEEGYVVIKESGERPGYYYGYPFLNIDPNDPKAGEKIMENFAQVVSKWTSNFPRATTSLIGTGGLDQELGTGGIFIFYRGRYGGAIPNPNNFLAQSIVQVFTPYDLRGSTTMTWDYDDARESTNFTYVPMIRRILRMSAAARSDPFMGSDSCVDDASGWGGKNQTMKWKLTGVKKALVAFTTKKKGIMKENPDKSLAKEYPILKAGYEIPGWKGAPWALVDAVWHSRDLYVVEMIPKDTYYNYGRQLLYVDKETYTAWYKVIYDRAGEYWKTLVLTQSYHVAPNGRTAVGYIDGYLPVDDKTHHATLSFNGEGYSEKSVRSDICIPADVLGPHLFTTSNVLMMSK